jgi:hypothetical protein
MAYHHGPYTLCTRVLWYAAGLIFYIWTAAHALLFSASPTQSAAATVAVAVGAGRSSRAGFIAKRCCPLPKAFATRKYSSNKSYCKQSN